MTPCPICGSPLTASGPIYTLAEILALWPDVEFSPEVVAEHARQSQQTRLHRCDACDFGIFLPQIIGTGAFYEALQRSAAGDYYVEDKWDFDQALADCRSEDEIIELGSGPGNFLARASARVRKAVGSEYNDRALALARAKGVEVFGPDHDLMREAGRFDAAFSFHVLEHVADPVGFVQTLAALVKPGGRIGLSVPNAHGVVGFVTPCGSDMPPHHATRWSESALRALAKKLGLRVERIAFEPLLVRDSYYLDYWIANRFPASSLRRRVFQPIAKMMVPKLVHRLKRAGLGRIPFFRGQAVYVLLARPRS